MEAEIPNYGTLKTVKCYEGMINYIDFMCDFLQNHNIYKVQILFAHSSDSFGSNSVSTYLLGPKQQRYKKNAQLGAHVALITVVQP